MAGQFQKVDEPTGGRSASRLVEKSTKTEK